MKKAHLDNDNNLLGWYDTDIHKTIPEPNIEVSEKDWKEAVAIHANFFDGVKFKNKDKRTQAEKDKNKEDIEWFEYRISKLDAEKEAWKLAGKPKQ